MANYSKYAFAKKTCILGIALAHCLLPQIEASVSHAILNKEQVLADLNDSDFVKLKGKVIEALADTWCSAEKASLLMDLTYLTQPKICVEIGAYTGSSVLPVAATLKLLEKGKIYGIDSWSNAEAVKHLADNDPNRSWWSWIDLNDAHNKFVQMNNKWNLWSCCLPVQSTSENAAGQFDHIDYLHLDGNLSEFGSLQDAHLYFPKVRSGGYVLISNLYAAVHGTLFKIKSFSYLFPHCDVVAEIDQGNTVLLRKK